MRRIWRKAWQSSAAVMPTARQRCAQPRARCGWGDYVRRCPAFPLRSTLMATPVHPPAVAPLAADRAALRHDLRDTGEAINSAREACAELEAANEGGWRGKAWPGPTGHVRGGTPPAGLRCMARHFFAAPCLLEPACACPATTPAASRPPRPAAHHRGSAAALPAGRPAPDAALPGAGAGAGAGKDGVGRGAACMRSWQCMHHAAWGHASTHNTG